jgi:hypothetical protein
VGARHWRGLRLTAHQVHPEGLAGHGNARLRI